jgi:hypothetical protein
MAFFDLVHPITLGMDHSTIVDAIMPQRGIQYSDGIGGGNFSKFIVYFPGSVSMNLCFVLPGYRYLKKSNAAVSFEDEISILVEFSPMVLFNNSIFQ